MELRGQLDPIYAVRDQLEWMTCFIFGTEPLFSTLAVLVIILFLESVPDIFQQVAPSVIFTGT